MKHVLIIFIVLGLILGFGYWTLQEVSQTSEILLSQSSRLEENVNDNLWDRAQDSFKTLKSKWQKIQPLWTILLNHAEIDNIDMALARIEQYINAREKGLALAEISSLKLLIKHIPEKEKLILKNIF